MVRGVVCVWSARVSRPHVSTCVFKKPNASNAFGVAKQSARQQLQLNYKRLPLFENACQRARQGCHLDTQPPHPSKHFYMARFESWQLKGL
eukprot:m.136104 g.136104  ORF g.136104 m.136104 type:complete len:91 (-) comp13991_c0_seq1:4219-4491(-)